MKRFGMKASIIVLCMSLLLSLAPGSAQAQDKDDAVKAAARVKIQIGQPSAWSMAQAHYLLASMHKENQKLKNRMPNEDDLNPNVIHGSRIEVLRTLLQIDAQFDQAIGTKNRLGMQRFNNQMARKELLESDLAEQRQESASLTRKISQLNSELAALNAQPAAEDDTARQADIKKVKDQIAEKEAKQKSVAEQMKNTKEDLEGLDLAVPELTAPQVSGAGQLPTSAAMTDFLKHATDNLGMPKLHSSMVLDNFIQMQYEIISKQLTLLRDEIGPDERIVFLELPASIYTVPDKADDYTAQIIWQVTKFYDDEGGKPCDPTNTRRRLQTDRPDQERRPTQNRQQDVDQTARPQQADIEVYSDQPAYLSLQKIQNDDSHWYPVECASTTTPTLKNLKVRTLDIIPRQSALNVNEFHATLKQRNFLAAVKFLIGFAGSVNYQRQKELYEQFVQQDIFASGFGKGNHRFGWTFGPLPGSKRIAPGVRTTYAVLAVPATASGLELSVKGVAYKRKADPTKMEPFVDGVSTFRVRIPNELTEGFHIDEMSYVPVTKGNLATVILKGPYFSPQVGILVNGAPLTRVLSIGRYITEQTPAAAQPGGANGAFEQVSSDELILAFKMGDDYVGTPIITLVTPEKTNPINFYPLDYINRVPNQYLYRYSVTTPMFIGGFSVEKVEDPRAVQGAATYVQTRLVGSGFRSNAQITVNDRRLRIYPPGSTPPAGAEWAMQESTEVYVLNLLKENDGKYAVRYSQNTKQGWESKEAKFQPKVSPSLKLLSFRPGAPNKADLELELSIPGAEPNPGVEIDPADGELKGDLVPKGNGFIANIKAKKTDFLIKTKRNGTIKEVLAVAIPLAPSIHNVENVATGNPSGPAEEEANVRISGENLHHVVDVMFGSRKATIVNRDPSGRAILVQLTKSEPGKVPVYLETDQVFEGLKISNAGDFATSMSKAYYTYEKKKEEKKEKANQ
ncbi:MAG TPA: hypothetical protein VKA70_04680 [Blastocatellia bacterium]|nr:hypothetical protein [Blastocatellia bacterium]